jgi:hypothetical protein
MADYRDEFQKLLESTFIPSVGDRAKIEKELNAFLGNVFQHIPEKLFRYRKCDQYSIDSFQKEPYMYVMQIASLINTIHMSTLTVIEKKK